MLQETVSRIVGVKNMSVGELAPFTGGGVAIDNRPVCCHKMPVFADFSDPDAQKNDYMEIPFWYIDPINLVTYLDDEELIGYEFTKRETNLDPVIRTIFEIDWRTLLNEIDTGGS